MAQKDIQETQNQCRTHSERREANECDWWRDKKRKVTNTHTYMRQHGVHVEASGTAHAFHTSEQGIAQVSGCHNIVGSGRKHFPGLSTNGKVSAVVICV